MVAMRRRFRFVLSGCCAALAALLCVLYGQQVRAEAERVRAEALERYGGEVVSLVVASEDLEAGDVVTSQNVAERDWLADLAPVEAVVDLDQVVGTEVTVPLAAGLPLTSLNFRTDETAVEVPEGCVALSIPVTEKCVLPASADAGASLVAYRVSDAGTRVVSDRLQVLRVAADQGLSGSRGTLTVSVRPEDVPAVLSSSADGTLRLALPADDVSGLMDAGGAGTGSVAPQEEGTDEDEAGAQGATAETPGEGDE